MTKWFTIQKLYSRMYTTSCTNSHHDVTAFKVDARNICYAEAGIYPSTILQPVNGSKNLVLNWVIKIISLYVLFLFFFGFEKPSKEFLFFLLFGLDTYKHAQTKVLMYLPGQLFSKTTKKTLKFWENPRKMHFTAIHAT